MGVLVDSSVWVSYFRSGQHGDALDYLIDENLILTNELILTELIPYLKIQNKLKLVRLLDNIERLPLNIDWQNIVSMQTACLKKGLSGIGIPDHIIAQNAMEHNAHIFSEDKHFLQLQDVVNISIYQP